MTGRRRRELAASFRLFTREERWFVRDLFAGVLAFVVWVAGTAALASVIADASGIPLASARGEAPSSIAIAVFVLLWLVAPAVAAVVRLRQRLLNLRGNVEKYYRFDHPTALLAPPALLLIAVGTTATAFGAIGLPFSLVMIPVGLFFLVRTLAFSYRVYSFSHPLLVLAFAAISIALSLAGSFVAFGTAMGREALVDQVLLTTGLPAWLTGTVRVEGVPVSGAAVAALLPVMLATGYVLVQSVAALVARLRKPEIDRSDMRTGQRYPPFLPEATPVETSVQPTGAENAPGGNDDVAAAESGTDTTGDGSAGVNAAGDTDAEDEDLDDVSNTRVFTPPADDAGSDIEAGSTTAEELASDADGGARPSPAADGEALSSGEVREHCRTCGESFAVDSPVRFCPSCGAALDGE